MDTAKVEEGIGMVLNGLLSGNSSISWEDDPNFKGTPKRIAKAFEEMLFGIENTAEQVEKTLEKSFPSNYDGIIFSSGIHTVSMCPHHLMLVKYTISVGYIPAIGGQVIGASKLARVACILSARPVLQEDLTSNIAEALNRSIKPRGVMVVVSGKHDCMVARGVKQPDATFETSVMTGMFREQAETRAEFFSLLTNSK